jgi:hypothetical protein
LSYSSSPKKDANNHDAYVVKASSSAAYSCLGGASLTLASVFLGLDVHKISPLESLCCRQNFRLCRKAVLLSPFEDLRTRPTTAQCKISRKINVTVLCDYFVTFKTLISEGCHSVM